MGSDPIITIIGSDAFTFKWLFIQPLTSANIVTRSPSLVCEVQNKSDYMHKAVVLGGNLALVYFLIMKKTFMLMETGPWTQYRVFFLHIYCC